MSSHPIETGPSQELPRNRRCCPLPVTSGWRLRGDLEHQVARAQLPKAIVRFSAGEAIAFGPLMVSRAGIAAGGEVSQQHPDRTSGHPRRWPRSRVGNAMALLTLTMP
jgi:hypothetical protein